MSNPRDILNELKWRYKYDLDKAEIWYLHRGAPNDTRIISGEKIVDITRSFMKTKRAPIPHHRIFKIKYDDEVIFEREKG